MPFQAYESSVGFHGGVLTPFGFEFSTSAIELQQ